MEATIMKKRSRLILSVLVIGLWMAPAHASEVLGLLEIRGIDNLSSAVFDLTKAVGQPLPKEMASIGIHAALGTLPGMGIEPNGTLRAVWLAGGDKGRLALLLPVANEGAEYLASLGQSGWATGEDGVDDILHLIPGDDAMVPWPNVFFLKHGATLIAASSLEDVREAADALPRLPTILPAEGVAALQIRPAALVSAFGPVIETQMNQAFQAAPGQTPEAAAVGRLYVKGYLAAARQTEAFTKGVGVADGHLNLHLRIQPVAGSTFARWFETVQAPSAMAAVVNLPGALFVETAHLGDVNLLAAPYHRYMQELLKLLPAEVAPANLAEYLEQSQAYFQEMAGDFGIALLPPAPSRPLRIAEYIGLKNPDALRGLYARMMVLGNDMMKSFASLDPNQPVRVEMESGEAREYREIPIDRITYRLSPGAAVQMVWPADKPLELGVEMAWLPTGVAIGVGGEDITEALIDRALDGAASPVAALPSWQAFYPNPEKQRLDETHVAIFDGLRTYLELLDSITGGESAASIPAGAGNLDSLSYKAMGGLMTRVRFSLEDIAAIVRKGQEAQQKAMEAHRQRMEAFEMGMEDDDFLFEPMEDAEFEEWLADDEDEAAADDAGEPEEAVADETAE
jgi:hypothetical protein